jgi:DNA repair exonuclease SbcCD ATPase subunit
VPTDPVLEIADELYALPMDRFTPERDARLKAAKGDRDLVAALKALRKPSVAAWVVNLLVRREPEQVEQVLAVGAALREAQVGMDGTELRALTRQRRQLTSAVTAQARSLAAEEGVRVTQSVADEVEATLTAGLIDAEAARAVRSGLLVRSLRATGVDAVDVASAVALPEALGFAASPTAASAPAPPDLHVVPRDESPRRRDQAEEKLAGAEEAVTAAAAELATTAQAVAELQARSLQLQSEIDELKRRLAGLESDAEETDDELAEAEETHGEAEQAHAHAVRERDAARKALDSLT